MQIRIYKEEDRPPVAVCSQLPDNDNTSVTNMAEYLAAEVIEEHGLPRSLSMGRALPRARGGGGGVVAGGVLLVGTCGGMPRRRVASSGRAAAVVGVAA